MLQAILAQIFSGQAKSISLLLWAAFLFVYFLPSVLAFNRGHRRFFLILVLNVLLSPAQGLILHFVWPSILVADPQNPVSVIVAAVVANLGLGWIALLAWALQPGQADPKLLKMQETKYYDAIAALPLILWFAYGALQLRAVLAGDWARIAGGNASLFVWVQFFALLAAASFDLLLVYVLAVRDRPVARSQGVLPARLWRHRHFHGCQHPAVAGGASDPADADIGGHPDRAREPGFAAGADAAGQELFDPA